MQAIRDIHIICRFSASCSASHISVQRRFQYLGDLLPEMKSLQRVWKTKQNEFEFRIFHQGTRNTALQYFTGQFQCLRRICVECLERFSRFLKIFIQGMPSIKVSWYGNQIHLALESEVKLKCVHFDPRSRSRQRDFFWRRKVKMSSFSSAKRRQNPCQRHIRVEFSIPSLPLRTVCAVDSTLAEISFLFRIPVVQACQNFLSKLFLILNFHLPGGRFLLSTRVSRILSTQL